MLEGDLPALGVGFGVDFAEWESGFRQFLGRVAAKTPVSWCFILGGYRVCLHMQGRVLRLASKLAEPQSETTEVFLLEVVLVLEEYDTAVRD